MLGDNAREGGSERPAEAIFVIDDRQQVPGRPAVAGGHGFEKARDLGHAADCNCWPGSHNRIAATIKDNRDGTVSCFHDSFWRDRFSLDRQATNCPQPR